MRRVVVEESFNVTGRLDAQRHRDCRARLAKATSPGERAAMLITGATREDVPPYSILFIEE